MNVKRLPFRSRGGLSVALNPSGGNEKSRFICGRFERNETSACVDQSSNIRLDHVVQELAVQRIALRVEGLIDLTVVVFFGLLEHRVSV